MAISECHYRILKQLREDGTLPDCKSILNIGQPNWYGDMDGVAMAEELATVIHPICAPKASSTELAEFCYGALFDATKMISMDLGGDERAIKHDLNGEFDFEYWPETGEPGFDLVVNHGTAEHIFNIGQVFRTMHDHCRVGGFIIHEAPFTGWIDHGFYSLHPTLFYDLAAANGYAMPFIAMEIIDRKTVLRIESREDVSRMVNCGGPPAGAMLFVVLQKGADEPFQIPQQGVYEGNVSEQVKTAWRQLR